MKRVMVIGCPGSGKSTFSKKLGKITGLPLYHLDMMYWNSDMTKVPKEVFRKQLNDVIVQDEWLIDGNYNSTIGLRLKACDTVIFLDYPTEVCLEGIRSRRGKARSDMPWVEAGEDEEFIRFVNEYDTESRPSIMALLEECKDKDIYIFKSRKEADGFLERSKK